MGKKLIIAEKPSVASDIAKAIGGFSKEGDFFESEDFVLSSAVGHLLEITMPPEEEVKRGKWSFAHLPAIPSSFALNPIEKTADRLKLLGKLIKRSDIDSIINACDAGREGELIFRYIVAHYKNKKPIQRLWLQSMTPEAIRQGFKNLRSGTELEPLADAAMCRSESDWLIGINGTRAMTAFNSKSGGFQLTTVGRVQTPTLAILVEREDKIRHFVSKPFWTLEASFQTKDDTEYTGHWFDAKWKKNESDPDSKADRIPSQAQAEAIRQACLNQAGRVEEESKSQHQQCPLLFDLTSLQREANQKFGFSAKTTLGLAQALYEKHKVITYPRTDARALPEDYIHTVTETLEKLGNYKSWESLTRPILKEYGVKPNKRIFDNSKISDHFAIIPTPHLPKNLNELEEKLYELIAKRFMAIFYPAAEFLQTTRITTVQNHTFKSEGKILVKPGWLAVYGREAQDDDAILPPVDTSQPIHTEDIEQKAQATKPPARYSEATLLSSMESAGKLIEDEELKAAIKEKGLGTPATRAAIIEGLLNEKYVIREGKELIPTAKASSLITLLRGLGIPEMFSPELTAEWEYKLAQIERKELSRSLFMNDIVDMTRRIVNKAKDHDSDTVPGEYSTLQIPCPHCGGTIKENYKKFQCQSCTFGFWKIIGGRQLELEEAETLIQEKKVGPLDGFRSRLGRAFTATLILNKESGVEFDFGDPMQSETPVDPINPEPLGQCPKCKHAVLEYENAYYCSQTLHKACDFRFGKQVLQRPIDRQTLSELLTVRKTKLLDQFISSRTKRPFSAHLVLKEDGAMGFEFAAKPEKAAQDKTAESKTTKKTSTKKSGTKSTTKKKDNHTAQ